MHVGIPMYATGRANTCTRDGEEEFQGRVEASGRGFLMRNLPDVAGRLSALLNVVCGFGGDK